MLLDFYNIKHQLKMQDGPEFVFAHTRDVLWLNAWGGLEKVAAIGIRVSKWIAYHGFSININNDLNKYKNIIPCGIEDKGVTNLKSIINQSYENLDQKIINNFIANLKN